MTTRLSTADRVLQALVQFDIKRKGASNLYRSNSPLRPGSNSHAFTLRLDGPEHGAYYDHVSGDKGSLYELVAALNVAVEHTVTPSRPTETIYTYTDAKGVPLFDVVRYIDWKTSKKAFYQRQPNGTTGRGNATLVLYHLPEVLAAVSTGERVYIVEGEKDVENLRLYGLTATCNAGGAGKWDQASYNDTLRGGRLVILEDNDQPGEKHADQVQAAVQPIAAEVRRVKLPGLPPKGDVSDWLAAGHTIAELNALVERTTPIVALVNSRPAPASPWSMPAGSARWSSR